MGHLTALELDRMRKLAALGEGWVGGRGPATQSGHGPGTGPPHVQGGTRQANGTVTGQSLSSHYPVTNQSLTQSPTQSLTPDNT